MSLGEPNLTLHDGTAGSRLSPSVDTDVAMRICKAEKVPAEVRNAGNQTKGISLAP